MQSCLPGRYQVVTQGSIENDHHQELENLALHWAVYTQLLSTNSWVTKVFAAVAYCATGLASAAVYTAVAGA